MVTPQFCCRILEIRCFLLPLAKLQAASLFSLTMQDYRPCFSCSCTHACPWLNVKQKRDSQSNVGHLGFKCTGRVVMRLYSSWGKAVKPPKSFPAPSPPPPGRFDTLPQAKETNMATHKGLFAIVTILRKNRRRWTVWSLLVLFIYSWGMSVHDSWLYGLSLWYSSWHLSCIDVNSILVDTSL